jgi:hypothetical protein
MENRVKISLCVLLFTLIIAETSFAPLPSVTVTGTDWVLTIDSSDLQSGAGSDLVSSYENTAGAILIELTGLLGQQNNYRVDVSKSDTNWHGNFRLFVKRTGDGTGNGTITGGTTYQEITNTDQQFWTGVNGRHNVPIQLKLDNVSVQIPPDTYTTTVNYTVVLI